MTDELARPHLPKGVARGRVSIAQASAALRLGRSPGSSCKSKRRQSQEVGSSAGALPGHQSRPRVTVRVENRLTAAFWDVGLTHACSQFAGDPHFLTHFRCILLLHDHAKMLALPAFRDLAHISKACMRTIAGIPNVRRAR